MTSVKTFSESQLNRWPFCFTRTHGPPIVKVRAKPHLTDAAALCRYPSPRRIMAKPFGIPLAQCPACGVGIGDAHPYTWCASCGEPLPSYILNCLPQVTAAREAQTQAWRDAQAVASKTVLGSEPPSFSTVFQRMFSASAMMGVICALGWLIFSTIPFGGQMAHGFMAVMLVTGGSRATNSINAAWLELATTRGFRLPVLLSPVLKLSGILIFCIGWFFFVNAVLRPTDPLALIVNGVSAALWLFLLYGGALAVNAAKRSDAANVSKHVRADEAQDQVVFFRSFVSDASRVAQEGVMASFSMRTDEELLAEAVQRRGKRFFAIGRPGESLPQLGATRFYLQDSEWKEFALYFMRVPGCSSFGHTKHPRSCGKSSKSFAMFPRTGSQSGCRQIPHMNSRHSQKRTAICFRKPFR